MRIYKNWLELKHIIVKAVIYGVWQQAKMLKTIVW
jgi:hypothetical protein